MVFSGSGILGSHESPIEWRSTSICNPVIEQMKSAPLKMKLLPCPAGP
jgi:hypothetical protein